MIKEACTNLYRGFFAGNEVIFMLLCIAGYLLVIWGGGMICRKTELAGVRVKELSWLGSHTLLIYLYHNFFAWIISRMTGFSLSYANPSDTGTILKSALLTAGCLALCILRYAAEDRIKAKISRKNAAGRTE